MAPKREIILAVAVFAVSLAIFSLWLIVALEFLSRYGLAPALPWRLAVGLGLAAVLAGATVYASLKSEAKQKTAWEAFARVVGGEFVEGSLVQGRKVRTPRGAWTLTLDFVSHGKGERDPWARVRAPYLKRTEFGFHLAPARYRALMKGAAAVGGSAARLLRLPDTGAVPDAPIADPALASRFVLICHDAAVVHRFLDSPAVREVLGALDQELSFTCLPDSRGRGIDPRVLPPGVGILSIEAKGARLQDSAALEKMHRLAEATLQELSRLGLIAPESPSVVL